jgi:hypothetical protein
MTPPA